MKKRVLIVLLCFVGALSSAFAAEKKVQGVVISSEDNLPLIGASVYVTAEDLEKGGECSDYEWGSSLMWMVSSLSLYRAGYNPFLL